MIQPNINKLVTEWESRVSVVEKLLFKVLVGKFITHNDEKCTAIFYVNDIDVDGLLITSINNLDPECGDNYVRFGSNILKFKNLTNYKAIEKQLVIDQFSERMLNMFKTLTELTE